MLSWINIRKYESKKCSQEFPRVSFCNFNPYRWREVKRREAFHKLHVFEKEFSRSIQLEQGYNPYFDQVNRSHAIIAIIRQTVVKASIWFKHQQNFCLARRGRIDQQFSLKRNPLFCKPVYIRERKFTFSSYLQLENSSLSRTHQVLAEQNSKKSLTSSNSQRRPAK